MVIKCSDYDKDFVETGKGIEKYYLSIYQL